MAFIKKIIWLNEDIKEAEVEIEGSEISIVCFSCPLKWQEEETFNDFIHCYNIENIVLSNSRKPMVNRFQNSFKYNIVAKLIENNIVEVEDLLIKVPAGFIPKDIKLGAYIEFDVSRLDIY